MYGLDVGAPRHFGAAQTFAHCPVDGDEGSEAMSSGMTGLR